MKLTVIVVRILKLKEAPSKGMLVVGTLSNTFQVSKEELSLVDNGSSVQVSQILPYPITLLLANVALTALIKPLTVVLL